MAMVMAAKPRFVRALTDMLLATQGVSERKKLRDAFFKTFLEFGSETPDNRNCVQHLDYGPFKDPNTSRRVLGLKSKASKIPLSDLAWLFEGTKIPVRIRSRFPELTAAEWKAFQRLVTMILVALEQDIPTPETKRRAKG